LYFQALDHEGRLIQSMRSFVQAAPGTTRSCIGCHEHKSSAAPLNAVGTRSTASQTVSSVRPAKSGTEWNPSLPRSWEAATFSGSRTGTVNRPESPSPALRAPSPLLGEKGGMRFGSWERKEEAVPSLASTGSPLDRAPSRLQPESWGNGSVDYPSRVQPILDRHCVSCHGDEKGIAAGLDLSGGWTEHFNISYENLANRRETQLTAYWIAGIDCMNGTALWSAQIFPPRSHGSGAAPLAKLLVEGHEGRLPQLTRAERDLLMAWIDSNGLYYGTWDYTKHGYTIKDWSRIRDAVVSEMKTADCLRCHGDGQRPFYFENDWINLKEPQMSRILRAPLAPNTDGFGLGLCRKRPLDPRRQRIHLLWNGYAHAVLPPEKFPKHPMLSPNQEGEPVTTFGSPNDPRYQRMLSIIAQARVEVLAAPRVDMPGAEVIQGVCRQLMAPQLAERPF
ncbi:MAG: hypothetical protein HYY23_15315, partial [Verrucomicrobia bacterium]|nr:hypothetical protein [Verrucomicrobiota bacterium]